MKILRNWINRGVLFAAMIGHTVLATPPTNDSFTAATVLIGLPAATEGSNVEATLEPGEPLPPDMTNSAQASVWYRWTSPTTGAVQVDVFDADFSARLAIWTNDALPTLGLLQAGNNFAGECSARFSAKSGATYRIAVYGRNEARGAFHLHVTNDVTSSIAGIVTTTNGNPIVFVPVEACRWDAAEGSWIYRGWDLTGFSDGRYLIEGLPPGTYRVQFGNDSANFLPETWDDAPDLESGTSIEVPPRTAITNINAALAAASYISGRLTGVGGQPLPDARATVYQWDDDGEEWDSLRSDNTDTNGVYSIGGLKAGVYRVKFEDRSGDHLSEFFDNAPDLETASNVVVAAATTVSNVNAVLAQASKISGNVTASDETTPLADVPVEACQWVETEYWSDWSTVGQTSTDSNGFYAIGGLKAGTYRVQFARWGEDHLPEAYDDASSLDEGDDIFVPAATTISNINASLVAYSKISGTVTGPDGTPPLAEIWVGVHDSYDGTTWSSNKRTWTDTNGHYLIEGLLPGTYRIDFSDDSGTYQYEAYSNAADVASGTDIPVEAETTVSNVNASLARAATISGTVTGPGGAPSLPGIQVTACQPSELGWQGWQSVGTATTDFAGHYMINGLLPGAYRVQFQDPTLAYFQEVYNNAADLAVGTDVVVAASANLVGIDAELARAAGIAGTVTADATGLPLEGIKANAFQWQETEWWAEWVSKGETWTATNGSYFIGGLTAGTYRVSFSDWNSIYLPETYNDKADLASGTDVPVPHASTVSNVDAVLATYSTISGTVTGTNGTPLHFISAAAYQWSEPNSIWMVCESDYTDWDGHYEIGGLTAGTYRVGFTDEINELYAFKAYPNAATVDAGSNVVVPAFADVEGIDVSLGFRSTISGIVTGPNGSPPLPGIEITAYLFRLGWEAQRQSTTGADGRFVVAGLEAGTYRVGFRDIQNGDYAPEAYNDAADVYSGTDIPVGTSSNVAGINANLTPASKISGRVTGPVSNIPLQGIRVAAYASNNAPTIPMESWSQASETLTGEDGRYLVGGLRAGTYRVGFSDTNWNYYFETYDNAPEVDFGRNLAVPAAATLSNINASLTLRGQPFPPLMADLQPAGQGNCRLTFAGQSGQSLVLQQATSLTGQWTTVGDPFSCWTGLNYLDVVPTPPATYWRVVPSP